MMKSITNREAELFIRIIHLAEELARCYPEVGMGPSKLDIAKDQAASLSFKIDTDDIVDIVTSPVIRSPTRAVATGAETMIVADIIEILSKHDPNAILRFSVADDESEDDGERWFVESGIEDCFGDAAEVTICLVGRSNLRT